MRCLVFSCQRLLLQSPPAELAGLLGGDDDLARNRDDDDGDGLAEFIVCYLSN